MLMGLLIAAFVILSRFDKDGGEGVLF